VKLYTAEEMSRADRQAQDLGIPGGVLMERAGAEMARVALEAFAPRRALVVAGGGNNGGDGFVVAREVHLAGVEVAVLPTKDQYEGDPGTNFDVLRNLGVRFVAAEELETERDQADLVVDALLGTGFSGEVREKEARLIEGINGSAAPVLAVDVPSGVDGATGEVGGAAVRADVTVCAHAVKVGCVVSPGRECAGEVVAVDIGIPPEADVDSSLAWTDVDSLRGKIPRTTEPAHKYSAGALLVVAGSRGTTGAPQMVVRGAERTGCGIVFLATAEGVAPSVDLELTEALVHGVPEDEEGYMISTALGKILELAERTSALVVGPGMGVGQEGRRLLEGILREVDSPVLLDADAVTNLAGTSTLAKRDAPTVITPHAGELGRLLGTGAREVDAHRLSAARSAAETHGCCVLLKGSDTLVARDGGSVAINSTGDVALATAGTGDVLSGVIGALLSRGMDAYEAARAGAWVHGRAAELWLERTGWPAESMIATDLLDLLPLAVGELL
jgi:ADP-dependent NAD(P)H-hydrate dehydratase / NAD(P)H-hydrate epimerase